MTAARQLVRPRFRAGSDRSLEQGKRRTKNVAVDHDFVSRQRRRQQGVDISLAAGWIEVASIVHPPGEVVASMRPVSVFAKGPGSEIEQLRAGLQGRWRQAARAVMVLLSLHGLPPSQIAELPDCHPATVRRWIIRFNNEGLAGLADRPRSGRPRLGGRRLTSRITALLSRPGPWTPPRIGRYLEWPQVSMRTLYRRVRLVAIWRRPKLTARGDPAHDQVVAGIVARLLELPRRAVVLAEDESHLNLLPHVRASWTLRGLRPEVLAPGTNRKVTVLGAIEMTSGRWVYRLGRRCAADFIALPGMLDQAFPPSPGDRGDLRQRQHSPRPQGHRVPQNASPAGTAVWGPVQPAR
jgi:Winged helix-turn helix